jgi:hypothetical protein
MKACGSNGCLYNTAEIPQIEQRPKPLKSVRTATTVHSKKTTKTAKASPLTSKVEKPISPQASNGAESISPIITPDHAVAPPQPEENAKNIVGANANVAQPGEAFTKIAPAQTSDGFGKDKFVSPIATFESSVAPPQPVESAKSVVATPAKVAASNPIPEPPDSILNRARATVASKMEYPPSVAFEDMTRAIRSDSFGRNVDTICGHVSGKKLSGAETGKRAFVYLVQEDIAFVDYGNPGSAGGNAFRKICTTGF